MRLPQLPSTSRLASSLLVGLLATGVWLPCQPPAPASALVRDGGSTLRLAVAVAPEAATLPVPGLGAAVQPPAGSAAGRTPAADAKAQASRQAAQAAAIASAERMAAEATST